jgi:hypothetical protein
MAPEVYGALSLACHYCKPADGMNRRSRKERQRRYHEKVQKHLARALKYQAHREGPPHAAR